MSKGKLTKRQLQITHLVARGISDAEIAERLGLAEVTISIHVQNAINRLRLDSRVQLTLWAIKHGLVKLVPRQEKPVYVEKPEHAYQVGDKVQVTNHKYNGAEGEIVALLPYGFVAPAYDVRIDGMIVAVSERSIEKIETPV